MTTPTGSTWSDASTKPRRRWRVRGRNGRNESASEQDGSMAQVVNRDPHRDVERQNRPGSLADPGVTRRNLT